MNAIKIRNSKFEIRNPKQIQIIKKINDRNYKSGIRDQGAGIRENESDEDRQPFFVLNFGLLNFEFVSNVVLRASNFNLARWAFRQYTDEQMAQVSERLKQEWAEQKKKKEFLLCRSCSHIITTQDDKTEIHGQHMHTFKNPAGIVYTIGCFTKAVGCFNFGEPTGHYTWFPGFAWSYANCFKCFAHLGWFYRSGETHFYGLILDHLAAGPSPIP